MKLNKLTCTAVFVCFAAVLSAAETWLPPVIPIAGVRVGLGNIVTMFILYIGGSWRIRDVFTVALLRCCVAALITGSLMSAAYGIAGGILSVCGAAAIKRLFSEKGGERYLPIVGACSAICHMAGQLTVAVIVYGGTSVLAYMPVLLATAVVGGAFTGLCTLLLLKKLPPQLMKQLSEL